MKEEQTLTSSAEKTEMAKLKWQTKAESTDPLSSEHSRKICGKWEVERKSWNKLKGAQKAFYRAWAAQ